MSHVIAVQPDRCNHCASAAFTNLFQSEDYISRHPFDVFQCADCGLAITRFGAGRSIDDYYASHYYGDDDDGARFLPILEKLVAWFRNGRNRYAMEQFPPNFTGNVLDIGCGRGLLLSELKERGWTASGTEASEQLARHLSDNQGLDVRAATRLSEARFPDSHFDLVYSWHSLEHVASPAETVDTVYRVLKPGGVFIVEVPNFASWQSRIGRARWFHLDVPRHLFHFSADNLEKRLDAAGFEIVEHTTHSLEHGYYGMVQSLMNRICLHSNFLYHLIRRERPTHSSNVRMAIDAALTITLMPVIGTVGIVAEAFACTLGKGGVLRFTVRKA